MLFSMVLAAMVPGSMADPLMRFMMPLVETMRQLAPPIDRVSADAWRYLLLGAHTAGGGLGRPTLLHPRVVGVPAPQRRHEYADRHRDRSGFPLQPWW